jgi:hypothetical protein
MLQCAEIFLIKEIAKGGIYATRFRDLSFPYDK